MNIPIIIQEGEIVYDTCPEKFNGVRIHYADAAWLTDYGLIIPIDCTSYNLKMFLLEGRIDLIEGNTVRSLLLDVFGLLKEIIIRKEQGEVNVTVLLVNWEAGNKYVRGTMITLEETVTSLFSLDYDNTKILDYFNKFSPILPTSIKRHRIIDLVASLEVVIKNPKRFHSSVLFRNDAKH